MRVFFISTHIKWSQSGKQQSPHPLLFFRLFFSFVASFLSIAPGPHLGPVWQSTQCAIERSWPGITLGKGCRSTLQLCWRQWHNSNTNQRARSETHTATLLSGGPKKADRIHHRVEGSRRNRARQEYQALFERECNSEGWPLKSSRFKGPLRAECVEMKPLHNVYCPYQFLFIISNSRILDFLVLVEFWCSRQKTWSYSPDQLKWRQFRSKHERANLSTYTGPLISKDIWECLCVLKFWNIFAQSLHLTSTSAYLLFFLSLEKKKVLQ